MKRFKNEYELQKSKYYERIKYMVTDSDFRSVYPQSKIIKYADLDKYNDIYELLPQQMDFVIIITENKLNSGHWVCILRFNKYFEYFDSYGTPSKNAISFTSLFMNNKLGNNYEEDLGKILKSIKHDDVLVENDFNFQQLLNNINTCGNWILMRIHAFLIFNMDITEFEKFIKKQQKKYNKPFDEIILYR